MILEKIKTNEVKNLVGTEDGFDMQISQEDMSYIMNLLSDLYKDPYSIIPQEALSNSWDSHIEAGVPHEPIICELKKDVVTDKWFFAASDFGVGISPERIKIFGSFGKSTKRLTNDYIGGWGLGAKCNLCYTKTFYVETVYDSIKYIYFISPNEAGTPHIELMSSEDSDLSNRSRIWFYLKPSKVVNTYSYGYTKTEQVKFFNGIKKKTAYFNNLVYDIDYTSDNNLDDLNLYKRIEGKHFVYSEIQPFNNLHIIIGQVPYEIDWQSLGLSAINVPIGVKIEKGVLPTPTREAYSVTDLANVAIKEAIKLASTELVEYYNKSRIDVTDWKVWLKTKDSQPRVMLGKHEILINELVKYSTTPLKAVVFTPLKNVEDVSNLGRGNLFPFRCVAQIKNGRKSEGRVDGVSYSQDYGSNTPKMSIEGQFKSKVNSHIGKTESQIYVFKKTPYRLKDYKSLLMLKRSNRATWRQQIQAYQNFVDIEWSGINSYDDIVVPKEVKIKGVRTTKPRDVVNIHVLRERETYNSDFKSATDVWPIKDFDDKQFNKLCIYGVKDDLVTLDAIWRCVPNNSMMVFHCTEANHKYLDKHNFVNVKNWHKTKAFSRIITSYKIKQLLEKNKKFTGDPYSTYLNNSDYNKQLGQLSNTYQLLINELFEYQKKNLASKRLYDLNEKFMEASIETANIEKLWDYSVYYKIQQLEEMIEKFKFVEVFKPDANWIPVAANYIKKVNKNVRLNLSYYQLPKENKI